MILLHVLKTFIFKFEEITHTHGSKTKKFKMRKIPHLVLHGPRSPSCKIKHHYLLLIYPFRVLFSFFLFFSSEQMQCGLYSSRYTKSLLLNFVLLNNVSYSSFHVICRERPHFFLIAVLYDEPHFI